MIQPCLIYLHAISLVVSWLSRIALSRPGWFANSATVTKANQIAGVGDSQCAGQAECDTAVHASAPLCPPLHSTLHPHVCCHLLRAQVGHATKEMACR